MHTGQAHNPAPAWSPVHFTRIPLLELRIRLGVCSLLAHPHCCPACTTSSVLGGFCSIERSTEGEWRKGLSCKAQGRQVERYRLGGTNQGPSRGLVFTGVGCLGVVLGVPRNLTLSLSPCPEQAALVLPGGPYQWLPPPLPWCVCPKKEADIELRLCTCCPLFSDVLPSHISLAKTGPRLHQDLIGREFKK